MTYAPKFNVYADKHGVVTHDPGDKDKPNRLVIQAGSPVSAQVAGELKLRDLDELSLATTAPDPLVGLKPADLSAADQKKLDKARAEREVAEPVASNAPTEPPKNTPKTGQGDAK